MSAKLERVEGPTVRHALLRTRARRPVLAQVVAEVALAAGLGAGIGALVGVLAGVLEEAATVASLVKVGAVTGFVAGGLAAISGREVLPRLMGLPFVVRTTLQVLTLAGGALLATVLGFFVEPAFSFHMSRAVLLVASINGLFSLVVGLLVLTYEGLMRRLAGTQEELAAERVAQIQERERATRAELLALQARINPHFFFNALNTVAALVPEDPRRAEKLLERFADLFRYAFRRGAEESVAIEEEITFAGDYLEIERARFGDGVKIQVEIDEAVASLPVPPLVLQPLVENAILHGRDPETGEGEILVSAGIDDDGCAVLSVRDHGPGPGVAAGEFPVGHALENVSARLWAATRGRLEIGTAPGGSGTLVRLVLPPAGRRSSWGDTNSPDESEE